MPHRGRAPAGDRADDSSQASSRRASRGASELIVLVALLTVAGALAWAVTATVRPQTPRYAEQLECTIDDGLAKAHGVTAASTCEPLPSGVPGGPGGPGRPGGPKDPGKPADAATSRIVSGCDPMTGERVEGNIDDFLGPRKGGPFEKYLSPGQKSAIGTVWTVSCEPTSTTGNGSCMIQEDVVIYSGAVKPDFGRWLFGDLPVQLRFTWVVLRQEKNDGTTDFLTFFMIQPQVEGSTGGESPTLSGTLGYTKAWFALYRTLSKPPPGSGVMPADEMMNRLSGYGALIAGGGLTDDDGLRRAGIPAPFLKGAFDGVDLNLAGAGVGAGVSFWRGPYRIILDKADPTNPDAVKGPAYGGPEKTDDVIPGDLIKLQPNPAVELTWSRTVLRGLFTDRLAWLGKLQRSSMRGIHFDQLDMASFKTDVDSTVAPGQEQGVSIEMVVRIPVDVALKYAPKDSPEATQAQAVQTDARRRNAKNPNVGRNPYIAIRYTKKVDVTDRTPDGLANLERWKRLKRLGAGTGANPSMSVAQDIAALFGPRKGSAAIQMYAGFEVRGGTNKTTVIGRSHKRVGAWHNAAPGDGPPGWKKWDSCNNLRTTDPSRFGYGSNPTVRNLFTYPPRDVFNPDRTTTADPPSTTKQVGLVGAVASLARHRLVAAVASPLLALLPGAPARVAARRPQVGRLLAPSLGALTNCRRPGQGTPGPSQEPSGQPGQQPPGDGGALPGGGGPAAPPVIPPPPPPPPPPPCFPPLIPCIPPDDDDEGPPRRPTSDAPVPPKPEPDGDSPVPPVPPPGGGGLPGGPGGQPGGAGGEPGAPGGHGGAGRPVGRPELSRAGDQLVRTLVGGLADGWTRDLSSSLERVSLNGTLATQADAVLRRNGVVCKPFAFLFAQSLQSVDLRAQGPRPDLFPTREAIVRAVGAGLSGCPDVVAPGDAAWLSSQVAAGLSAADGVDPGSGPVGADDAFVVVVRRAKAGATTDRQNTCGPSSEPSCGNAYKDLPRRELQSRVGRVLGVALSAKGDVRGWRLDVEADLSERMRKGRNQTPWQYLSAQDDRVSREYLDDLRASVADLLRDRGVPDDQVPLVVDEILPAQGILLTEQRPRTLG